MNVSLVVVRAFAAHFPGDVIDDADAVAALLAGPHAGDVVKVAAPTPLTKEG